MQSTWAFPWSPLPGHEEKRAEEAGAVAPPPGPAAPAPRRIFGTIVRQPEILAAKLAIV